MVKNGNLPKMPTVGREHLGHFAGEHVLRHGHNNVFLARPLRPGMSRLTPWSRAPRPNLPPVRVR